MENSNSLILTEKIHFTRSHFATASQYLSDIQLITVTGTETKTIIEKH